MQTLIAMTNALAVFAQLNNNKGRVIAALNS